MNQRQVRATIELARRDDRGAILTFGVFLAPFLVGAVYYLVASANVMMQREGLQSAADATAFAPAVASARGMNEISVLNVLMMSVMSVVIPVRALVPAYAEVASWGCFLNPCDCIRSVDAARASIELQVISARVEERARDLLDALSDAESAIAERTPQQAVVAARQSAVRTSAFLQSGARPEVFSPTLSSSGCRRGLPVEEDSFRTVCKRTRPYVHEVATRIASETLHTFGICLSGPFALGVAEPDLADPENGFVCREAASPPCEGDGPHPMKVADGASNGSDYMQYWARVQGRSFDAARSGVEVGARSRGSEAPAELDVGFAESEFYFDCSGAWSSCNQDQNAMWDTRWTARLRRVHAPKVSFPNDSVVHDEIASPEHWASLRSQWLDQRRDFTTGARADTEAARTLMESQEGPLQ